MFISPMNPSSPFLFLYNDDGDGDDDNNNNHLAYAAISDTQGKSFTVLIPKGSANPEVDITNVSVLVNYLLRRLCLNTD